MAPNLKRNDPRRRAYEERFSVLAAKGRRRAEFRKGELTEIRSERQAELELLH